MKPARRDNKQETEESPEYSFQREQLIDFLVEVSIFISQHDSGKNTSGHTDTGNPEKPSDNNH